MRDGVTDNPHSVSRAEETACPSPNLVAIRHVCMYVARRERGR